MTIAWPRSVKIARSFFYRPLAPDYIRKMRVEGLADSEIADLFRHAADELDQAEKTSTGNDNAAQLQV